MSYKLESRLPGNINNLRYADDTTLMAESEEELKSLLMRVEEESEKVHLKWNIKKSKIMASGPITSWQIEGGKAEAVTHFLLLGSADGDYSREIRWLLLGRKAKTILDSVLKCKDITFLKNGPYSQSYVLSNRHVQMWEWDNKGEDCWRTDAFQLWYWRRLMRVPWKARCSNQSILRFINPEYSLEGLMLKLKLQYFGHLMWTADSLEKTLMLGKTEGRRKEGDRGWAIWMASLIQWTWLWANSRRWWGTGQPGLLHSMGSQSWTWLGNWLTTAFISKVVFLSKRKSVCTLHICPEAATVAASPLKSNVFRKRQLTMLLYCSKGQVGWLWILVYWYSKLQKSKEY